MVETRHSRSLILLLVSLAAALPQAARAQIRLPLEQAGARSGHDFAPAHLGQRISVSGVVGARPYRVDDGYLLPIEDSSRHGIVLMGSAEELAPLTPGDNVDVTGTMDARGGMPVLKKISITRTGAGKPPQALQIGPDGWHSFEAVGVLVTAESLLISVDLNADGDVATIGDRGNFLHVLLPAGHRSASSGLGFLSVGDRVRVTGTLIQYLKAPPYDGGFYILLPNSSAISLVEKRTFLPPLLLLSALAATGLILIIWWIRERRMAMQRRTMRVLHSLSEEIIAAQTPSDLSRRLAAVLPQVTSATSVRLYLFNSRTRSLERVVSPVHPEPVAFSVDTPPPGTPTGVAVCFRNRRLLSIPDTRRSPFLKASARSDVPRAALFVPTFAHQELLGVLELSIQHRPHFFTQEEQAAAQHIANQVAAALKLQEQQTIREQLFRSEKLAATGQLISGVASELRAPLDTIVRLSAMLAPASPSLEKDARTLASEARRASEIVSRLVSFARADDAQVRPVEVNQLLASLIEFRAAEWDKQGVHVHQRLSSDLIYVHGSQGQLEQVFLNLLVHAEQCAEQIAQAGEKAITIASSLIARRLLVEIGFPAQNTADPLTDSGHAGSAVTATGLAVCRGILQTHGGEIYYRVRGSGAKFEVELPISSARSTGESGSASPRVARTLTVLVVDSDAAAQRQMVNLLSGRSHRVVPIASHQEAVDVVQRMRFDCVFFAARPANPNWMEMFERIRSLTSSTVLVTDGFDPDLHRGTSEHLALARPVEEADLDQILDVVSDRADTARVGK